MVLFHYEPCEASPDGNHSSQMVRGDRVIRWICEHCHNDTVISPEETKARRNHVWSIVSASTRLQFIELCPQRYPITPRDMG